MKRFARGASTAGIVVGLVAVAAIAFVVVYFASDVFRTKANAAYKQFAEWTPENSAKDPLNYLNFCEEQTKSALEKCKASEVAIRMKKGQIEEMHKTAVSKNSLGNKALGELKTAYKAADESKQFPL